MKKSRVLLILFTAILLAVITRFYGLGTAPAGLNSDEAGQGYSAYSLLKTGKDEFGKSFPILFRSSGDFKTPVYTYISTLPVSIFGLTTFAIRLTSAIAGVLTVPILYLLVKKLSGGRENIALVSAIILAISPWSILFSRTGYEANLALFLFMAGCLAFFYSLKKPWLLILSAILFAIAIPAYHSERIVIPLLLVVLFFRYKKILLSKTHLKYLVTGGIIAFLITSPTISVARTPGFFARVNDLNIFSVGQSAGYLADYHGIFAPIVNNKIFLDIHEFASLYLSYFSPRFMFVLGDSGPRSSYPELSTFFIWQFPFYVYGVYLISKSLSLRDGKETSGELNFFTIAFLLIAPIPAALTRDPYSSTRALQMVIPLVIVVSLAIVGVLEKFKKWKIMLYFTFAALIIYSLLKLYSSVIILDNHYHGVAWEYGWQPTSEIIKTLNPNLPIIVDSSRNVGWIQLAFFLKVDPAIYQKQNFEVKPSEYYTKITQNSIKYVESPTGQKITWRGIDWQKDLLTKQYLIGDNLAISDQQIKEHNLKLIKDIFYADGSVDLRIVETNPKK